MNTMLPVRKQILWLNIKVFSLVYCMFWQCCQTLRKSETNSFSGSNFLTVVAAPEDYITGDPLDRIQKSWEVWIIYEPTHTEEQLPFNFILHLLYIYKYSCSVSPAGKVIICKGLFTALFQLLFSSAAVNHSSDSHLQESVSTRCRFK